jgi:hypothetical protein
VDRAANGYWWNPTRRATNDFIVANFDALAKTVERDTPGQWPVYASGFCAEVGPRRGFAFWKERAPRYAGADRELANALEAIELCYARARGKQAQRDQRLVSRSIARTIGTRAPVQSGDRGARPTSPDGLSSTHFRHFAVFDSRRSADGEASQLLNQIIRTQQHVLRNGDAERLRGFQVDHKSNLVACSTGRSAGLAPFNNLVHIFRRVAEGHGEVIAIAEQPARDRVIAQTQMPPAVGWPEAVLQLRALAKVYGVRGHHYGLRSLSNHLLDSGTELRWRAGDNAQGNKVQRSASALGTSPVTRHVTGCFRFSMDGDAPGAWREPRADIPHSLPEHLVLLAGDAGDVPPGLRQTGDKPGARGVRDTPP